LDNLDVYLETGREAEVRRILDEYGSQLRPPSNIRAVIAELQLALDQRDIGTAETQLAAVESIIATNRLDAVRNVTLNMSARLEGLKGNWERACALRQEHLRANPTDPLVHTGIATCLRELGRYDEAEREVRLTLARIPASATAEVELARILEAKGSRAAARQALERALAIWSLAEPDFEPAAEARALLAATASE
jgi:Flp pilus assembly protein TadD